LEASRLKFNLPRVRFFWRSIPLLAFLHLFAYFVRMSTTPYDRQFYKQISGGSYRSAMIVVPILRELFRPLSVIDVGCGIGTWLRAFQETGVTDIIGIDGPYVEATDLLIPHETFLKADLSRPLAFSKKGDLALCLEVAEHLPVAASTVIVRTLCSISDIVVFSAAVPHQTGTDHINCQWQSYWADLFAAENYGSFDLLRPLIRGNHGVDWWYQQNMVVYINLAHEYAKHFPRSATRSLDLVHPFLYLHNLGLKSTLRLLLMKLRATARRIH